MKQIAQNYKTGELTLVDAPVPACRPGGLLVRTEYSLISSGTELMKVGEAKLSLLGKVRARPDQVRSVLDTLAQQGPEATFKKVMNRLDAYTPLGYSLCGTVIEVGAGVTGFAVGQRVACAGNQYALHAEVNWVPVNLCVPVPDEVDPRHAAFTTVGAIAMQGLRQADMALGEVACVIGLGLIGQLLVQLLRANGVRVVGIDISPERCALAEEQGAACAAGPEGTDLERVVAALAELTGGFGADAIFLSAGGDTNTPVELAARLARDRGRVVDIGKCSLDLPWNAYYEKELDVRFSRSYGPGRYDPIYEEQGVDYPVGYVRWTEGRNLACFVDLLAQGQIELDRLISAVTPFDTAAQTYEQLDKGELRGIGFLFEYPPDVALTRTVVRPRPAPAETSSTPSGPATKPVRIGFIGAGNYASTMLLPHLKDREDVALAHVATASSLSCMTAQRRFGFETAGTDYRALLADESIDAVVIATRHQSHASMACEALRAGKAVFVEKPLAISQDQLEAVMATVAETGNGRLQVGFNRRFCAAPHDAQAALRHDGRPGPGPVPGQRRHGRPVELVRRCQRRGHALLRRGWPLHRHAGLVVRRPADVGARHELRRRGRPADHDRLRRRLGRYRELRDHGQQALPQGDGGPARRGQGGPAGQLPLGLPVGRPAQAPLAGGPFGRQGPEGRARGLRPGGADGRRDADHARSPSSPSPTPPWP